MADEVKMYRTVYVSKNQWGKLYGSMSWDGEKYSVVNIDQNGNRFIGDVTRKTGKKITNAKTGKEQDEYEVVGAMRWDTESGTGEYVTERDGLMVKFPMTNTVENTQFGQARVLRCSIHANENNKWRKAFDDKNVMTVTGEMPNSGFDDEVPF